LHAGKRSIFESKSGVEIRTDGTFPISRHEKTENVPSVPSSPCTPGQEAQLSQIASHAGTDTERLVKDAALRLLEQDARFRAAVREGIAQPDREEFIEEEEMDARIERMLNS